MGVKERRQREREQRRNDIIDAAEQVFFSKGLANATMDEVAEVAELSKGTIYLYFRSKDELYLAIIYRGCLILRDMFTRAVNSVATGLQKVHAIGRAYHQFFREYTNYFNAVLYYEHHEPNIAEADENSLEVACARLSDDIFDIVIAALQTGISDGTIRKNIDPRKVAFVLWGQTTGLLQIVSMKGQHLRDEHQVEPDALIETQFELIRFALELP